MGFDVTLPAPRPVRSRALHERGQDLRRRGGHLVTVSPTSTLRTPARTSCTRNWGALRTGRWDDERPFREAHRHFIVDEARGEDGRRLLSHCLPLRRNVKATDGVVSSREPRVDEAENRLERKGDHDAPAPRRGRGAGRRAMSSNKTVVLAPGGLDTSLHPVAPREGPRRRRPLRRHRRRRSGAREIGRRSSPSAKDHAVKTAPRRCSGRSWCRSSRAARSTRTKIAAGVGPLRHRRAPSPWRRSSGRLMARLHRHGQRSGALTAVRGSATTKLRARPQIR